LDIIAQIGPGGTFLDHDHTATHFRKELFLSPFFPVQTWPVAHSDPHRFDMIEQAKNLATRFWKHPEQPVLPPEKIRAIDQIVLKHCP
jgi:trimethylamine:corrinoid methyltransferase-like protein